MIWSGNDEAQGLNRKYSRVESRPPSAPIGDDAATGAHFTLPAHFARSRRGRPLPEFRNGARTAALTTSIACDEQFETQQISIRSSCGSDLGSIASPRLETPDT